MIIARFRAIDSARQPVILLAAYAVFVWYLAMRWRRRWYGFVAVGVLGAMLYTLAPLIRKLSPDWQGMTVLVTGETLIILAAGWFICLLPRVPRHPAYCPICWYNLSGLEETGSGGIICPECGTPTRPDASQVVASPRSAAPRPVQQTQDERAGGKPGDEEPPQG